MLAFIIGAGDQDVPRLLAEIDKALANGKLKASKQELATFKTTRSRVKTSAELDAEGAEMDEEIGDEEQDEEESEQEQEEGDDGDDLDGFIVREEQEAEEEEEEEAGDAPEPGAAPRFAAQQRVEARWRKGPTWYGAVVTKVDAKRHTYTVKYDEDGAVEQGVMEQHMRQAKPHKASSKRKATTDEAAEEQEQEQEREEQEEQEQQQPPPQGKGKNKASRGNHNISTNNKKARGKAGKSKEEAEYDGDMQALRAAMLKNKAARTDGFESFAARWARK
jgi:hypothetical protein